MMNWLSIPPLAAILAGTPCAATANCGSIPFEPEAQVFRPHQRAVTAFDGREQILVLSTDLRADRPTRVLEVLPFPNRPEVTRRDDDLYQKALQHIEDKLCTLRPGRSTVATAPGGAGLQLPRADDAANHERIEVHATTVMRVVDPRQFTTWVTDYLRQAGVDEPKIPARVSFVVRNYVRDGFTWFVFNVIELGTETAVRPSMQYRFATSRLYYPLRIMGAESGETTIHLALVSPRLVKMPDLRPVRAVLLHQPVGVDQEGLRYLDRGVAEFFGRRPQQLRLWEIKGTLGRMRRDVLTDWF